MAMGYVIDGPLGVDLTAQYASHSSTPHLVDQKKLPPFAVGSRARTSNGEFFRFVSASAAKTKQLAYVISSAHAVGAGVTTSVDDNAFVGVPVSTTSAPTSIDANADTAYFWIQTGGLASVTASAAAASDGDVCAGAVAGKLDDGDSSGLAIIGAKWTAAASASDSVSTIFCAGEYQFAS